MLHWITKQTFIVGIVFAFIAAGPAWSQDEDDPDYTDEDLEQYYSGEERSDDGDDEDGEPNCTVDEDGEITCPKSSTRQAIDAPASAGRFNPRDIQVTFAYNSATLSPRARQNLDQWVVFLTENPLGRGLEFEVAGHSDASGSASYNQALSERRAAAVKDYLVSEGVESGRLTARGYGFSELENTDDPYADENRRVEMKQLPRATDGTAADEADTDMGSEDDRPDVPTTRE